MNKQQIPNLLTGWRGVGTLLIIALFFLPLAYKYQLILILFLLSVLSDTLDGYLARRFKAVSDFGKIFDPLVDKVLTISLYFLLLPLFGPWLGLLFIFLMLRDLVVDGLKNYLLTQGIVVQAIGSAKLKTSLQMMMLFGALVYLIWPVGWLLNLTYGLALLAVLLAYYSGLIYWRKFLNHFKHS